MPSTLTELQIERLRSSFTALAPKAQVLFNTFSAKLLQTDAGTLFPTDLQSQHADLLSAMELVVTRAHDLASLEGMFMEMGVRCAGSGAEAVHYPVVRDALLDALHDAAGAAWTNEIEEAWTDGLNIVAGMMLKGAERAHHVQRKAA